MKNLMKHITIALVLCAIPAMALGQTADCEECNHQLSVYRSGGFVATAADDAEMVNFRASCNSVTRTGQLTPNDDGLVNMLLTGDYACDAMDGKFEIGPITDGGWFWIHIGENSAVGNIVAKDILMNTPTEVTDAGDTIETMEGAGATLLTHTASGRVGLLPTILPEPPMPPAAICGPRIPAGGRTYTSQQTTNCMLGNGGTKIRLSGTDRGRATSLAAGAMLQRPFGTATYDIHADLWLNETGSYSTAALDGADAAADAAAIQLGWPGKAVAGTNWLNATWTAAVGGVNGGEPSAEAHGVVITDGSASTPAGQTTVTISASATYCPSADTKHPLTVTLTAAPDAANAVFPAVRTSAATAAERQVSFTVVCASAASANQGQELVPENPFPVE